MLTTGNKLNLTWLSPALVLLLAVAVGTVLKYFLPLSLGRYSVLLFNLVGTVLLASAFEPQIPVHGNGGWWARLRWAVSEFPKHGSTTRVRLIAILYRPVSASPRHRRRIYAALF